MKDKDRYQIFEFHSFRMDAERRHLYRNGSPVTLTAKAFDALLILVRNAGATVSKDQLMNLIWPETAVEENNLTQQISVLRRTLGEGAREHKYIVTIPGHGYRFIAPVKEIAGTGESEIFMPDSSVPDQAQTVKGNGSGGFPVSRTLSARAFALTVLLLTVVAFAVWFYSGNERSVSNPASQQIAVLPFNSLNGGDEFLGTGMSDTLIAKLGNIPGLTVRPTSSVIKYAGADAVSAGRDLRVDRVIEGTLQSDGEQIRVNVQMLDVKSGTVLWGQSFDDKSTGIFEVQDSIVSQVANALQIKLSAIEENRLRIHSTENADAYRSYVRGRFFWNKRSREGMNKAIDHFEEAINYDPNYALAYAGLADSYLVLNFYDLSGLSRDQTLDRAKQFARKALELDETLAEAHTSLAFLLFDGPAVEAEKEFRRAIELNPNYATAHHWYSEFLTMQGRDEEAMREIEIAIGLDPVSPIITTTMGERLYYARRYDEAIQYLRQAADMDDKFFIAHYILGMAYEQKGMYSDAISEFQEVRNLTQPQAEYEAMLAHAYALSGNKKAAEKILAGLLKNSNCPHAVAVIYLGLGDNASAIRWLKRMGDDKMKWSLKTDPRLDGLRSYPEFQQLISA